MKKNGQFPNVRVEYGFGAVCQAVDSCSKVDTLSVGPDLGQSQTFSHPFTIFKQLAEIYLCLILVRNASYDEANYEEYEQNGHHKVGGEVTADHLSMSPFS